MKLRRELRFEGPPARAPFDSVTNPVGDAAQARVERSALATDRAMRHVAASTADADFLTADDNTVYWFACVCDLAVAPAGPWLIGGLIDGTVAIWQAHHKEIIAQIRLHTERVVALALDTNAEQLWTGSWDGTARRLDPRPLAQSADVLQQAVPRTWG